MLRQLLGTLLASSFLPVLADIAPEPLRAETLESIPAHTLLVNSFGENAILFDTDTLEVLGMISTGIDSNAFEIDLERGVIHTAETYLSRHTRGERTDVISTYDLNSLSPLGEIVIPPKHAGGSPMRNYSAILEEDDTQLMLVTNITPGNTISVANLGSGKFLKEISTAGCGLVYPDKGFRFFQLCGDGTIQVIRLDAQGNEIARDRSPSFFDLREDPLMEKAARSNRGWVFTSFLGRVVSAELDPAGEELRIEEKFHIDDGTGGWRIGGMQPLALHRSGNLLLALMHPMTDEKDTGGHKAPGIEVWYLDADSGALRHRLALEEPATAITVSQDDAPRLYAGSLISNQVHVYDLKSARLNGTIKDLTFPTILQSLDDGMSP